MNIRLRYMVAHDFFCKPTPSPFLSLYPGSHGCFLLQSFSSSISLLYSDFLLFFLFQLGLIFFTFFFYLIMHMISSKPPSTQHPYLSVTIFCCIYKNILFLLCRVAFLWWNLNHGSHMKAIVMSQR